MIGMGVLKFVLPSNDLARRLPGLRKAYITGLDRTPGRMNVEFRNGLMGCYRETTDVVAEAGRGFVKAAMSADEPEACLKAAQASLESASRAGDLLTEAYLSQILQNRLAATGKLSTQLGCMLSGDPDKLPFASQWTTAFNSCQIGVSWKHIVPSEGKYRWELLDAKLAWCRRNK